MKIYIWGFMGSGKSTLSKKWSEDWSGEYFDFDEEVARRVKVAPAELGAFIERKGWPAFRAHEANLLKETLEQEGHGLYSLGGGTLANQGLWELIDQRDDVRVLWLKTDIEVCWSRVMNDSSRPLVKKGKDSFLSLYHERLMFYERCHHKIDESATLRGINLLT